MMLRHLAISSSEKPGLYLDLEKQEGGKYDQSLMIGKAVKELPPAKE